MNPEIFQLKNGIRVVFQPQQSHISHACILIHAGSRDEKPFEYGIAHFIEHLLFKKTKKRNTHQILNRLEVVGADLNAFTNKEYTCLHASFLNEYLNRTLDLFEDLIFNSVFPENEIEKERGVILDEIASYLDSPEDAIMDDFEDQIFKGHGLGHNILGYSDQIKHIQKEHIHDFIKKHYVTESIVIGISGNYTRKQIEKSCERYFSYLENSQKQEDSLDFELPKPQQIELLKPINQAHYVLGAPTFSLHDERKYTLYLINNYLGGMGMSSKLNMVIREKYGIAYTIESNYSPFTDTGLFYVYFGTDPDKYKKALKLVFQEFKRLRENKLSLLHLKQAKAKFKGQIALGEENRMGLLISFCKNLLDYDRIPSLEEFFTSIDKVSASDVMEVAQEILQVENFHSLYFKPDPQFQD